MLTVSVLAPLTSAAEPAPAPGTAPAPMGGVPAPPGTPSQVSPAPISPQPGLPELPGLPEVTPQRPLTTSPKLDQAAPELTKRPLTINEVVNLALATNRNLAEAAENLYRSQGRVGEAHALMQPTVGIQAGEIYQNFLLEPAGIIAATMPIDVAGVLRTATSQAQFQEVAARLEVNRARNQVVGDVKNAFYGVLRAKALVAVATENLQNSMDRLKDANLRYRAGTVSYYDVVRAQTDIAVAQRRLIQAKNAVSLYTASLSNTIGIRVSTPLETSDTGAVAEPEGVAPPSVPPGEPAPLLPGNAPPPTVRPDPLTLTQKDLTAPPKEQVLSDALKLGSDYEPLVTEALANRPEVLDADATLAAARKGLKLAKRSKLPQVGVTAGFYDFRSASGTRLEEPRAGLQLVIPLLDGGLARAREQQARGEIAVATTEKRRIVDQISLEVEQAYLNTQQAREQVAVANQALGQARQGFELARRRYRTGVSPLLDVSDAQAALTLAETNQVEALYDYNQSRVLLDRALGKYAYGAETSGFPSVPPDKKVGRPSTEPDHK